MRKILIAAALVLAGCATAADGVYNDPRRALARADDSSWVAPGVEQPPPMVTLYDADMCVDAPPAD